ncbi:MAG: hypothetical protein FWC66_03330 [Oscillospiraceae bacterium]|nr:hypothetical protein [Oscillospiraceae bacterium]
MYEDLIKWFFNENGPDLKEAPPAAAFEHFQIKLLVDGAPLQEIINNTIREKIPEREAAIRIEKKEIDAATTPGQIIKFMRRGTDIINQQALIQRALEFEDEIIPEIIQMLKTSLNDLFIELAARALATCSKDISEELIEIFDEVRGAYAQSMILVALGFKASENHIPWLLKKFNELKSAYPNEDFCFGAYFALLEMESRFYAESKKFTSVSTD